MVGLPFLLSLVVLFISPSFVVMVWLQMFRRMSDPGSTRDIVLGLLLATLAAGVVVGGLVRLAGYVFAGPS